MVPEGMDKRDQDAAGEILANPWAGEVNPRTFSVHAGTLRLSTYEYPYVPDDIKNSKDNNEIILEY